MKTTNIFILLLFVCSSIYSQNKRLDSLQLILKKNNQNAEILNAIADEYKTINPDKLKEYALKALKYSQEKEEVLQEANSYLNLGNAEIIVGNYKNALQNFTSAKFLLEKENKSTPEFQKSLAKALGSIGIVFSEQSNYTKALQYYFESVKIYQNLEDEEKQAKIYNNIGIVYHSQNNESKALDYFFKTLKIQQKLKDKNTGITLTNIANSYLKQKEYVKASKFYTQAKLNLDENPNPRALGEWYNNMGLFYKTQKNETAAIENWQLAIKTFESISDKFGTADSYLYLGQLFFENNNLPQSILNANKALQLSKEIEVLEQQLLSEKLLSDCYLKQDNFKQAILHLQNYIIVKDKLINEENIKKRVETELSFDFEKRELLQNEKQKEQLKWSKAKIIFSIILALLFAGLLFLLYSKKQLKKRLTLEKELEEYKQKALHLQMNPHFVFNCLGSISSFIIQNGTEKAITYLAKFSKLMRLTLEYSKESLIPIDKEIESLQNYLELEQLRFNNKFDFQITKSKDIEDDVALPPLLLQPIVENAIIHGVVPKKEHGKIHIDFSINNDHLICTVLDNGVGYNQSLLNKKNSVTVHKSMAIDISKKRLKAIENKTSAKSKFEILEQYANNTIAGTKVIVTIPIQYFDLSKE